MTITLETSSEILSTAVESPFGSWFEFRSYKWGAKLSKGRGKLVEFELEHKHPGSTFYAEVEVRHLDGDTGEISGDWIKVAPTEFRTGIEKWIKQQGKTEAQIADDHDAIDADGALQMLVLGEVIYG